MYRAIRGVATTKSSSSVGSRRRAQGSVADALGSKRSSYGTLPLPVDLPDAVLDDEEPLAARNAMALQRRADGQTDRLVAARLVRHDEVGIEGVQPPLAALDGGVEGLQVYGDVGPMVRHCRSLAKACTKREGWARRGEEPDVEGQRVSHGPILRVLVGHMLSHMCDLDCFHGNHPYASIRLTQCGQGDATATSRTSHEPGQRTYDLAKIMGCGIGGGKPSTQRRILEPSALCSILDA